MGREVKRVALDFSWPMDTVWRGFVNPHYKKCAACSGSGVTVARQRFGDLVSLLMLSGSDAANGTCHPYFQGGPFYSSSGKVPPREMVELTALLAGRGPSAFGHDAIDRMRAEQKILVAAGLPKEWGYCAPCNGEGTDPATQAAYEAWQPTEPPAGDGWQIWETVSEGSPITPVFPTKEALIDYLVEGGDGWDRRRNAGGWDRENAEKFVQNAWAPSLIVTRTSAGVEILTARDGA